jgi:hypothetical protein
MEKAVTNPYLKIEIVISEGKELSVLLTIP